MISPNDPKIRAALGLPPVEDQSGGGSSTYMMINGQMTQVPLGYNPTNRADYDALGNVPENPYASRYWPAGTPAGTPTPSQFMPGLAQQTYNAGGDLAAMAANTRNPSYGMGPYSQPMTEESRQAQLNNPNLPPAARPLVTAAPTSAPGVTPTPGVPSPGTGGSPSPTPAPRPAPAPAPAPAPTGGGTGPFGGGSGTGTGPFGSFSPAASYSSYTPGSAPVLKAAPTGGSEIPSAFNNFTPTKTNPSQAQLDQAMGQVKYQAATPGGSSYTTPQSIDGGLVYARSLPGGGEGNPTGTGTIDPNTGNPAPGGGASPTGGTSPGLDIARTGLMGNLTGRLEALQKAGFSDNALNWMQDLGNWYNDPRAKGPDAATSLQTGNNAYGNSPAMWDLNQILTNGIPGQDIIPGISNQLMTQENANPLSTQSRNIYSQLLSGEISPANQKGMEAEVARALGLAPGLLNTATGAAGNTPGVLNQAASYLNPGGAQSYLNKADYTGQGAAMVGNENPNVTNLANDLMTNGLQGGFADAFKRQVYDPQRDNMLADLQRRGVLDSGVRLEDEAKLFQNNFMDALMMQDLDAKMKGAGLAQSSRGLDQSGAGVLGNLSNVGVNQAGAASGIGTSNAGALGNLANTNLNYAGLMGNLGQGQQNFANSGYGSTTGLMNNILQSATGAGSTAEQNALNRVQTGMSGYQGLNSDLSRYLGLGTEATLGAGRLGLDAENAASDRFLKTAGGAGALLGQQGQLANQYESTQLSGLIDLINAAVNERVGQSANDATRSAANKAAVGQGIGAILSALGLFL